MSLTGAGPAGLEAERDFLIRSIADLDAEHTAGELDDDTWLRLRDDYTSRAAGVLRALSEVTGDGPVDAEAGVAAAPGGDPAAPDAAQSAEPSPETAETAETAEAAATPPPAGRARRSRRSRRLATVSAGVVFVTVAGLVLWLAVRPRPTGGTPTGDDAAAAPAAKRSVAAEGDALRRQAQQHPDDAAAHLVYARFLLTNGSPVDAVKEFDAAARLDPASAEARAYSGWILFLASRQAAPAVAADLDTKALARLEAAETVAPDYPDARFFRGMVLLRGRHDARSAVPEFERFLTLVPKGPLAAQVTQLLDSARRQAG